MTNNLVYSAELLVCDKFVYNNNFLCFSKLAIVQYQVSFSDKHAIEKTKAVKNLRVTDAQPRSISINWDLNCSDLLENFTRYNLYLNNGFVYDKYDFRVTEFTFTELRSGSKLTPGTVYALRVELITNGNAHRNSSSIFGCTG